MPIGAKKVLMAGANLPPVIPPFTPTNSIKRATQPAGSTYLWSTNSSGSNVSPDFSTLSLTTFAYSRWFKSAAGHNLLSDGQGTFVISSDNTHVYIQGAWTNAGSMTLLINTSVTSDGSWHHIYVKVDTNEVLIGDRIKVYIDGVLTAYSVDSGARPQLADTKSTVWEDGQIMLADMSNSSERAYQPAIFSTTLPDITDVYDGTVPLDVSELAGLFSLLDFDDSDIYDDELLALTWVSNTVQGFELDTDVPS